MSAVNWLALSATIDKVTIGLNKLSTFPQNGPSVPHLLKMRPQGCQLRQQRLPLQSWTALESLAPRLRPR